ncbi:peroxiredoxin [Lactarius quietus]|nr:peroxiredoxin [Lactarius quietus]
MSPIIQSPAPAFKVTALVDGAFKEVSLTDFHGQWVILMFYPLDFTLFALPKSSRSMTRSPNLSVTTLQCSYSHHAWAQQARAAGGLGPNLRIPMLADRNMRVARDYGCLIEDKGITFRASYLIDPHGVLRQITMNDLPVGRSVEEALRLIQAFQFTDKHGEVCPANWKEGSKTIRADPVEKLDYFSTAADGAHENGTANVTKRARMDVE